MEKEFHSSESLEKGLMQTNHLLNMLSPKKRPWNLNIFLHPLNKGVQPIRLLEDLTEVGLPFMRVR
jgi:hypothetical protein